MKIPSIPQDAPYSDMQRAWLSGFFAGLHTHMVQNAASGASRAARTVHIFYGSQTGNAEAVARDAAAFAKKQGLSVVLKGMDEVDLDAFASIEYLLIITSTYGEGEMPDNAAPLWQAINRDAAPSLSHLRYAVLALGDTSYDKFCQAGIDWDLRLEALGAQRLHPRVDCDVDFEEPAQAWIDSVLPLLAEGVTLTTTVEELAEKPASSQYSRKNPFPARMLVNRLLSGARSTKEIRHYELSLEGSDLRYEAGDALGVIPVNDPELVDALLAALHCRGDEIEPVNGSLLPLREALTQQFEIKQPSKEFVEEIAKRAGDPDLNALIAQNDKEALARYLWGRDTLDLLLQFPQAEFSAAEFLALLKPLQHRAYSISSSGNQYPDAVHLTVSSVRYQAHGRWHKGVCSTYLADLVTADTPVRCFLLPNKTFKVPNDDQVPMIMVGPGTGVAPFRAFLQERRYRGAKGKNWLFFGDRNAADDFIYRDELLQFKDEGVLTRLDLAFSRDQTEKIYVQDRMREQGRELYAWLQEGGYFFVCGDAYHMAKDVDQALHEIIAKHGGMSAEQAVDYVNTLKKDKRYVRDVY